MPRVISFDRINDFSKKGSTSQGQQAPVDVNKFFTIMMKRVLLDFSDKKGVTNSKAAENYLVDLYHMVIVGAKAFKDEFEKDNDAENEDITVRTLVEKHQFLEDALLIPCAENILCFVVKGEPVNNTIKSRILSVSFTESHNVVKQVDGKEVITAEEKEIKVRIPAVTLKLFQACISLMMVQFGCHLNRTPPLPPAPLGAKVIQSCKHENAEKQNWSVHGHAGLNFVASYKYKAADKDEVAVQLPPMSYILAIAMLMDEYHAQANKNKPKDKSVKVASKNESSAPTVKSIIQACQLDQAAVKKYTALFKPEMWAPISANAASNLADSFSAALKGKLKVKKSTATPIVVLNKGVRSPKKTTKGKEKSKPVKKDPKVSNFNRFLQVESSDDDDEEDEEEAEEEESDASIADEE